MENWECSCSLQDLTHTGHTSTDAFFLAVQILENVVGLSRQMS